MVDYTQHTIMLQDGSLFNFKRRFKKKQHSLVTLVKYNIKMYMVIKIDLTTQQNGDDGHTVTVNTTGQVGPNLNITDLKTALRASRSTKPRIFCVRKTKASRQQKSRHSQ